MSPATSGKYRLERRLGGGGMAEVFVGEATGAEGFSRKVAIKRVRSGYSDDPGFAQMFIAEARLSAELVHPNIVSVLDFDRDDTGQLFLVMELVDGKDLGALLASGPLPVSVVIFITGEILRGLGFAHDLPSGSGMRGIVHRDVSPHNVLLSWEGAVKVSDFGIAKALAASAASASVSIKGKPAYMSPEQANGQPLDGRSDLFAVGVMLWEMLTGQRLFVGDDTRSVLASVLFKAIPAPRTLRPDVPRDVERVALRLLERDLPERYATAEHALADLVACADAPRAGREALAGVLAERFPDAAPVRQSAARVRAAGAPPEWLPFVDSPTVTSQPEPADASPPDAAGVTTRTALPSGPVPATPAPPRRWLRLALLAIVLVAVSAAVAFAVVLRMRRRVTVAFTYASGSTAPLRATDHASGDARPTIGPREAGASAPTPDAMDVHSIAPAQDERSGTLRVVAIPILRVTIDGTPRGESPITVALPAGSHRVRLQNAKHDIDQTLTVTIVAQQTFTIERMPQ